MNPWIPAVLALIIGLALVLRGRDMRSRRGLGQGRTLDLDSRNLRSCRFGLAGRPDRIIAGGIPEEWKSARRVYDSHRAQMGTYFIPIEEETGVRPLRGFIVTGDGTRHPIDNTDRLPARVVGVAVRILAVRHQVAKIIQVAPPAANAGHAGSEGDERAQGVGFEPTAPGF